MQFRTIIKILGQLVALFSITMVPPALVSLIYKDGGGVPFVLAFIFSVVIGMMAYYPNRHENGDLKAREGFLIVVLFWLVLGAFASLPLIFLQEPNLSLADAVFEAFSGLTTTGATVLTGIEYLPKSVLFYRQQLQWFGGMGIIVLAVAILPMLGVGGMQLYRAEIPGPVKDSKMTPRIADTAKHLWYIYVSLTITCMLAYWAAGMEWFDAICHAFSTVAIGGFSNHDASLGYFINPLFNVALGMLFFSERLRRNQKVAVGLAVFGVLVQLFTVGSLPVVSLALASSFAVYGVLRKKMHVDSFVGLLIESLLMLPVAIIYWLFFLESTTSNLALNANTLNITLVMAGIVTTAPLLCFTAAAKRLTLSSLGFFQYIGPSIMFLLASFYYQESMQLAEFITFVFIWSALALYSIDVYHNMKKAKLTGKK